MADQIVKLSSRGQLVIPAELRRALDLDRGTRFEIEIEDDHIVLSPIREQDWRSLRGCLDEPEQDAASLTEALTDERRRERERDESA